jgi:hypothetical protein
MIASDWVAIVPVVPLAARLAPRSPGARPAKIACIEFVSWLIGPQLVSPRTRRPTSMSGTDSTTAIKVSHSGRSKNAYWMTMRAAVARAAPMPTQRSGNSPWSMDLLDRVEKVRARVRHLRSSAVRPPAINMPVPGHMIHRSTSPRFLTSLMMPSSTRRSGTMIHAITAPTAIEMLMRLPTSMPEPMPSRLTAKPAPVADAARPNMVAKTTSGRTWPPHLVVSSQPTADTAVAPNKASAAWRASGPRESRTVMVSAAAMPSGNPSCSSTM